MRGGISKNISPEKNKPKVPAFSGGKKGVLQRKAGEVAASKVLSDQKVPPSKEK